MAPGECFDRSLRVAWLLLCVLCVGCAEGEAGPERGALKGSVKLDGQPLPTGSLVLVPIEASSAPSSGAEITDGTYSIPIEKGPALGTYRVEIKSMQATGEKVEAGSPMPAGTMVDVLEQVIPTEYNKESMLTVEIESGENTQNFDLKSTP